MGWALFYREFAIYPAVVPVRDRERGIVGFKPIAHIQRRSSDEPSTFLRIRTEGETCFTDPAQARDYIVDRAKTAIDLGDAADTPGRHRQPLNRHAWGERAS